MTKKEFNKLYWQKNKERLQVYHSGYYQRNKERILARHREHGKMYYLQTKDKTLDRSRKNRKKRKDLWLDILIDKIGPVIKCDMCGYDKHFEVLEFHHINPKDKEHNFGALIQKVPTDERVKELDKGIFLCPTCHRELHWELRINAV